jgi:hypothetical protein
MKNETLQNIVAEIKMYGGFNSQFDFARKKIQSIINWSWQSKDFGVISESQHEYIYGTCIDALVELEERFESVTTLTGRG